MTNNNASSPATKKTSKIKTVKSPENERIKVSRRLELIRDAHGNSIRKNDEASDRMEDYLEVIYELIQQKGYASSIDIAECLIVTQPSVTKMMRRLDENRLISYEKYRGINLTERGIIIGKAMHKRHSIVSEFLKLIGVDEDIAHRDTEEIEHYVHSETIKRLQQLINSIRVNKIIPSRSS